MKVKLNTIYKNNNGEYFNCIDDRGVLVLTNPSYPFVFLPEVQEPLEEIGEHEKFKHLIKKEVSTFIEGDSLEVEIDNNGNLIPVEKESL